MPKEPITENTYHETPFQSRHRLPQALADHPKLGGVSSLAIGIATVNCLRPSNEAKKFHIRYEHLSQILFTLTSLTAADEHNSLKTLPSLRELVPF